IAVHLVGGSLGTLCVGLFATTNVNPNGADGLFYGGGFRQLGLQIVALVAVVTYSLVATGAIGVGIGMLVGNRVRLRQERLGLDLSLHGEHAYGVDSIAGTLRSTDPDDPLESELEALEPEALEPELEAADGHQQPAKTPDKTSP